MAVSVQTASRLEAPTQLVCGRVVPRNVHYNRVASPSSGYCSTLLLQYFVVSKESCTKFYTHFFTDYSTNLPLNFLLIFPLNFGLIFHHSSNWFIHWLLWIYPTLFHQQTAHAHAHALFCPRILLRTWPHPADAQFRNGLHKAQTNPKDVRSEFGWWRYKSLSGL